MASILDDIEKLLSIQVGDIEKLTRIKESYLKNGFMDVNDRNYIGELNERFLDSSKSLSKIRYLLSRLWK